MRERQSDPKRLPNETPRPPGELEALERAWAYPPGWRKISEINNSLVGVIYIGAAFLFFLLAGVLALLMRLQLARGDNRFIGQELYNQIFTMHGTMMMFLFAVPVDGGDGRHAAAADARRARPAVSAAQRLRLLGLCHRRPRLLLDDLLRPRAERRLVHVSAAHADQDFRRATTRISGCSASASSRYRRSPARSRSSSASCARARRA